jgi:hypothetical protein
LAIAASTHYNGASRNFREQRMACPYFMPVEKLEGGNWPHPSRLPLGAGWSGHCTAPGHEGETPETAVLEKFCNLGYADGCAWSPVIRNCDAVRFAVSAPAAESKSSNSNAPATTLYVHFVCERDHRPAENGSLAFDLAANEWLWRHDDARIQKMADCFLMAHMKRRI